MNRRESILAIASAISIAKISSALSKTGNETISEQIDNITKNIEEVYNARSFRELQNLFQTRAIAPRLPPNFTPISADAYKLIINFEVSSPEIYEHKYQIVILPGVQSGPTIGVGYDIGYVERAWLQEDWNGIISDDYIKTLSVACGIFGNKARPLMPQFESIRIPWLKAEQQFKSTSLPRFTAQTIAALPNSKQLSPDCLGALVSLVYNRGASFKLRGERFAEMRNIRLHMVNKDWGRIPAEFESMTRIWKGNSKAKGLLSRRMIEAKLFERGISSISRG